MTCESCNIELIDYFLFLLKTYVLELMSINII